ncbi:hypothetical protein N7463_000301 [Penicillium fimorum]|uniref:Transaldolase n=1 Tax=Penicillium fimorum TaxID=1882269 RepID=A0A9W9Y5P7_9EURO|nr:hypothetical protein N7463_000301 [Penicillium fimorum]
MGSIEVNVLQYLCSRTQVDLDSLDVEVARKGGPEGPWHDATSNQAEVFFQIQDTKNARIIDEAIAVSQKIHDGFPEVTISELKVEVATVLLAVRVIPFIKGAVHVMANPCYAFSIAKVIATGHRYHKLFRLVFPQIDLSRVVMKVPATFEGLQACRKLSASGVQTLATTVFTMEQSILAAEAGCISISPFVHELKAGVDPTYKDENPLLDLCVKAQQYYQQHGHTTRVKACSCMSIEEILQLSGVAAHTLPPEDLEKLADMHESEAQLKAQSLFKDEALSISAQQPRTYIDDEAKYRMEFAASDGGDGQFKLFQAITIFVDFQKKAELKMSGIEIAA